MYYDAIKIADVAPSNHLNKNYIFQPALSIFVLWPYIFCKVYQGGSPKHFSAKIFSRFFGNRK